ncbi:uncharacterized protein LOC110462204 [Mizuhopecten yessoensis]|uniref:Uncharacterized protein n=1 Tax=Mizuhopecten yessoensis TaxID=6573 RepID=A0A210R2U6_MIZYE|nr:uncharacterized protein LOC110462204 [Mizuhopecten yessoensis]XP_021371737.1 uncharacterized protein LOC110462204 [Mizuhopecten yessoensis]XP_021371744.1 uncharacterized protein LOC110462204 [Mizuhopecten yessoensis]OWF55265.1 hypothetical protein KP79_PYT17797 [Mizuhopecten yessoensis]
MGPFHDQSQIMEFADESIAGSSLRGSPNMFEEEQLRLESAFSEFGLCEEDTDEGRLSRALQSWMPDYEFSSIKPLEKPPIQPIYSGRLGEHKHLKRSSSEDSIVTKLSLFSCSTGQDLEEEVATIRKKRRKRKGASAVKEADGLTWGKLEELNRHKRGAFASLMKAQNAIAIDTFTGEMAEEGAIQKLMDPVEKAAMARVGITKGIHLTSDLKKSGSMTNIDESGKPMVLSSFKAKATRVASAGSKPASRAINLEEIRQQRANEKLAQLQKARTKRQQALRKRVSIGNIQRKMSLASDVSSDFAPNTPSARSLSPEPEERVSVWKGDREILEMDLRKGLTGRATIRIKSTTAALERVTGFGEENDFQRTVGRHEEFPFHIIDDYGLHPKIVQRIRISPQLSNVIQTDIKVRMGRPRYHEIRVRDMDIWNRGQKLDRGHTNLKVFNWLHSLREDLFEKDTECVVNDTLPSRHENLGILHVESADEPDVKPLYLKSFR